MTRAYDRAFTDGSSGPVEQCPTIIKPYRCILNRYHYGQECESYDVDGAPVLLGVMPVPH